MKGKRLYIILAILVVGILILVIGLNYLRPSPSKVTPESAGYFDGYYGDPADLSSYGSETEKEAYLEGYTEGLDDRLEETEDKLEEVEYRLEQLEFYMSWGI